ncbi:hypothetical protein AGLY_002045 [Aphis glycines]|uniref:TTF-type domain-containing protein n=1 Tax=Aphis glycines TaxID=307491 RepID=A0A6G0U4U9_APHGL|nr:hypothetical protein AGLY_002045 [Aphis glycines]
MIYRFTQNNEILNYIHASDPKSNEFLSSDLLVKLGKMYQPYTTNDLIEVLKNQCLIGKSLFLDNLTLSDLHLQINNYGYTIDNVKKINELVMVIPVSSASAERSLSTMRRVKTYFRSTMKSSRLNTLLKDPTAVLEEYYINVADQFTLSNDPSTFCMLTNLPHDMIEFLIQKGPMQPLREDLPQSKFPPNKQNRSFQTNWYWKIMPGNIHVRRDWLSYSIVNDTMYCHSCIIFGRNVKKAWVKDGFSAWHKAIECMTLHEISEAHVSAALKLKLRQTALPIILLMRENELQNKMYNREIVKALIDVSLFFAQNCVAFRGNRNSWSNIGNQGYGNVSERLLALHDSPITTGEQMFKIFELICKELNLVWINYLVGQSHDGAQNMRGQYNGLQTLTKENCPTAIFVWCCAHSLDPVDLFGNLETLYNFICGSKKKVAYYKAMRKNCSSNKQQGRRLKRVSTT